MIIIGFSDIGVFSACRREEHMNTKDAEDKQGFMKIRFPNTNIKHPRDFTITEGIKK